MFFPNTSVYSVLFRVVAPIFSLPSPSGYESYIIPGNGFVLFVTRTEGGGGAKDDVDDVDEAIICNQDKAADDELDDDLASAASKGIDDSDDDESDDDESDDDEVPPLIPPCVRQGASSFVREFDRYSDSALTLTVMKRCVILLVPKVSFEIFACVCFHVAASLF